MASVIIQTQPASVSTIPGQNITFSVTPSASFAPVSYAYQWKLNSNNIVGATASTYFIDPVLGDNAKSFTVSVSALSGNIAVATVLSNAAVLSVSAEQLPFSHFAVYPETGLQRFTRLRHLGYV